MKEWCVNIPVKKNVEMIGDTFFEKKCVTYLFNILLLSLKILEKIGDTSGKDECWNFTFGDHISWKFSDVDASGVDKC